MIDKSLFKRLTDKRQILLDTFLSQKFHTATGLKFVEVFSEIFHKKGFYNDNTDFSSFANEMVNFYLKNNIFEKLKEFSDKNYENPSYSDGITSNIMELNKKSK